ncbi:hypothetical protein [Microbacterium sp.]|uniref:hypothetical protein n=1 Tax=Microbacterium sp. TaxID=51671 RepID=UPI003565A56B
MAILAANEVIIPAASYFESPMCAAIIDELSPLFPTSVIRLVGGDANAQDFIHSKLATYDETGPQHTAYLAAAEADTVFPPFKLRARSATADITAAWLDRSAAPGFLVEQFGDNASLLPKGFLDTWQNVPDALGGRAFTPDYAAKHLADGLLSRAIDSKVHAFINHEYFRSFANEYAAGFVSDLVILPSQHSLDDRYGNIQFGRARRELHATGLLERISTCSPEELLILRDDHDVAMVLLSSILPSTQASRTSGTPKLDVHVDLTSVVSALKKIKGGQKTATAYQRTVTEILDQVFSHSLLSGELEHEINEGRKRIDVRWVNLAQDGIFRWISQTFRAPIVLGECKNYTHDVANPELDQLMGRFSPVRSEFGLLLCRKVTNRSLVIQRCRDTYQAQRGMMLVIDDSQVEKLASMSHAGGWGEPQADLLMSLIDEVMS